MFKHLLIAVVAVIIFSCSPKIMPYAIVERDSIIVRTVETIKDTVVVIAADSSLIQALLECDSLNQVRIKQIISYKQGSNMPLPSISIQGNVLTAKASVEERNLLLQYKHKYTELLHKTSKDVTKILEVNKLYWWQKTLMWCGIALLIYVITLIIRFIK